MTHPDHDVNSCVESPSLDQIIDFLPDAMFAIDLAGRVIAWNRAIAELTGVPSEKMVGKGDYAYSLPFWGLRRPVLVDLALSWDPATAESFYPGLTRRGDVLVATVKDPPCVPESALFWNSARKLYNSSGACIGAIEVIRDISELFKYEQALRQSEERYRVFAEATFEGIAISEDGRFIDCNEQFTQITGYPRSELLAMAVEEVIAPEDRERVMEKVRHRRAAVLEHVLLRKDRTQIIVEVHGRSATHGNRVLRYAMVRDITERRRAEDALRNSEERFRTLFENAGVGMAETDPLGRFSAVNERLCRILGLERNELLQTNAFDLWPPQDQPGIVALAGRLIAGELSNASDENFYVRKDGSIVWVRVTATALHSRLIAVVEDITERKRIEEALAKSHRELEAKVRERTAELARRNREFRELVRKTLAAMENERKVLAKDLHDSIGGTLAAIKYQLEDRLEAGGTEEQSSHMPLAVIIEYLDEAIRESRRITKQLRPSVLDELGLAAACRECISDFKRFYPPILIDERITISERELSGNLQTVLYRVLQEALNNVGRHSQAETVKIRLFRNRERVRLTIEDDGRGFDVGEIMSRHALSGYGLHSMKERVEICNGSFKIESRPGRGTRLDLAIPLGATCN